jgi:hypothetical protein
MSRSQGDRFSWTAKLRGKHVFLYLVKEPSLADLYPMVNLIGKFHDRCKIAPSTASHPGTRIAHGRKARVVMTLTSLGSFIVES